MSTSAILDPKTIAVPSVDAPPRGELRIGDILYVEDDPKIVSVCASEGNIPIWTQIRVAFLRLILSDMLYGNQVTGRSSASVPKARALTTMARAIVHNLVHTRLDSFAAPICIMGDGVANQWIDGRWVNRLTAPFSNAFPEKTLVIEDHFEWRWPFPRAHSRVLFHAPTQAVNTLLGKWQVKAHHRETATQIVDLAAARAREHLGWELSASRRASFVETLARKTAAMPTQYRNYRRMLERLQPRLLMVGAACYGPAAPMIGAARDLGIVTAEYQHGAISAGHDAYNFAPAVLASAAYRRTLPDFFLGYGKWWCEQINAPLTKMAVGNPQRGRHQLAQHSATRERNLLLIISDGIDFDVYLKLAKDICPAAQASGMSVIIRPHPLERSKVTPMAAELSSCGIGIDVAPDLYSTLARARMVVSEVSTVLFEAIGIADDIFVWDTPKARFTFPNHPFREFSNADELSTIIERGNASEINNIFEQGASVDDIWQPHWKTNYAAFISQCGITELGDETQ